MKFEERGDTLTVSGFPLVPLILTGTFLPVGVGLGIGLSFIPGFALLGLIGAPFVLVALIMLFIARWKMITFDKQRNLLTESKRNIFGSITITSERPLNTIRSIEIEERRVRSEASVSVSSRLYSLIYRPVVVFEDGAYLPLESFFTSNFNKQEENAALVRTFLDM